jgi:hypothetical protein
MTKIRPWLVCGVFSVIPLMLGCPVRELTIDPGFALFQVQQADSAKDVTGPRQVLIEATILELSQSELPVDFFDPNSDPLDATVPLIGSPIVNSMYINGNLGMTDSLLEIIDPIVLPQIDSQITIAVKFVEMNLVAVNPIEVTYNGGQNPEFWDVGIVLDVVPQVPGNLNVVRTGADSGYANGQVPIDLDIVLTRQSDSAQRLLDKGTTLVLPQFDWIANKNEMNWPANGSTNFVPGLSKIPVLGNLFRRKQVEASSSELLIFITPTIVREK